MTDAPKYTPEQLADVREEIVSGERSISYKDRRVEMRSLDELERIEQKIENAIRSRPRRHRAIFNKGL